MSSLTPWEPFDGMISLREALNRLFEESMVGLGRFEPFGRAILFDVRETDKEYVVEAALPGVTPDHIHITATADTLTIAARVSREEKTKEETEGKAASAGKGKDGKNGAKQERASEKPGVYVRRERYRGEMTRSMRFPIPIDPSKVSATFEHGELSVTLPKAAQAAAKQIPIQVKETRETIKASK
ncbi:MAG TPA: Hsp20/alpha crystallin family protein [Ktedonobacterales bacterium]